MVCGAVDGVERTWRSLGHVEGPGSVCLKGFGFDWTFASHRRPYTDFYITLHRTFVIYDVLLDKTIITFTFAPEWDPG